MKSTEGRSRELTTSPPRIGPLLQLSDDLRTFHKSQNVHVLFAQIANNRTILSDTITGFHFWSNCPIARLVDTLSSQSCSAQRAVVRFSRPCVATYRQKQNKILLSSVEDLAGALCNCLFCISIIIVHLLELTRYRANPIDMLLLSKRRNLDCRSPVSRSVGRWAELV